MFTDLAVTLKGNNLKRQTVTLWDIVNLLMLCVIVRLPNNKFLAFAGVTNHYNILSGPV